MRIDTIEKLIEAKINKRLQDLERLKVEVQEIRELVISFTAYLVEINKTLNSLTGVYHEKYENETEKEINIKDKIE